MQAVGPDGFTQHTPWSPASATASGEIAVSVADTLPPSPVPSPFVLQNGKDDTGLFQDTRIAFSHLLPGHPSLELRRPRQGEPPADAIVHLQDAPITIRYRLAAPAFAAGSAAELAHGTALRFASWRQQGVGPLVDMANATWLATWGVEGAAVAIYDVAGGELREDLFVLVRNGQVLFVTWTYPKGFGDDPAYATFASIAEATLVWDESRWQQRGSVWPESALLGAGLGAMPKPKHNERARLVASAPLGAFERERLLTLLADAVGSAGAPWAPLGPEVVAQHRHALLTASQDFRVHDFVEHAMKDVVTAHDLRGLAIMLGRAVAQPLSAAS